MDTSQAGLGSLDVSVNSGQITSSVKSVSNGLYVASFVPHKAIPHTIDVLFNKEPVPGKVDEDV